MFAKFIPSRRNSAKRVTTIHSMTRIVHATSATTGAVYPSGWGIQIPSERLQITLRPTVAQQELDTRATTGVVYWEGSQVVTATRDGRPLGGQAYVELTGYLGATRGP